MLSNDTVNITFPHRTLCAANIKVYKGLAFMVTAGKEMVWHGLAL